MIHKQLLQLTPYEYFVSSDWALKGVGVITDQQFAFYPRWGDQVQSHGSMIMELSHEIYPHLDEGTLPNIEEKNISIYLSDFEALIYLPKGDQLSFHQYHFLVRFLQDISRYNQEVRKTARIQMTFSSFDWNVSKVYDILEISERDFEYLRKRIRPNRRDSLEKVIGMRFADYQPEVQNNRKNTRKI